ncbi:ABC-2 type transport system ATP-binding protein [Clostridium cavendishii DSM 21758]|uniref:ABC-2 type transport system ATP-binding protein n=1 Tax=Clostridium cavendishii DSM 21758 TaxID=1121302 RepID=A0A1M6IX62_9CLOT|nr:ABC transporter ATP-binding protein [Clostridium cavendishii]SHJ39065.1 ABC-2 type transport system ATP-binding protein [Clostridium cavendishii DSM 21758]
MNAIETKGLTKSYGKSRGINNLDLIVKQGEFFGFIGPNGAGKSTTIRTLLNLIFKTSGETKIFGLDCEKDSKKIKELIGFVPSEVNYYKHMRVSELLNYAISFKKTPDKDRLDYLCKLLDVDKDKKISDLSLGNKKKIAIIQAIINKPKLLILDEPTNGLDPLIQKRLFKLLKEENENGMTIFFSSHNLVEVQKFCDKVAIIKEGKLIGIKTIGDLLGKDTVKVIIESDDSLDEIITSKEVSNPKQEDNTTSFLYNGNINSLINKLNTINLNSLKIENPSLEESFMSYYEEDC